MITQTIQVTTFVLKLKHPCTEKPWKLRKIQAKAEKALKFYGNIRSVHSVCSVLSFRSFRSFRSVRSFRSFRSVRSFHGFHSLRRMHECIRMNCAVAAFAAFAAWRDSRTILSTPCIFAWQHQLPWWSGSYGCKSRKDLEMFRVWRCGQFEYFLFSMSKVILNGHASMLLFESTNVDILNSNRLRSRSGKSPRSQVLNRINTCSPTTWNSEASPDRTNSPAPNSLKSEWFLQRPQHALTSQLPSKHGHAVMPCRVPAGITWLVEGGDAFLVESLSSLISFPV